MSSSALPRIDFVFQLWRRHIEDPIFSGGVRGHN